MTESLQEEHGNPIFGVKFNELLDEEGTFAAVGSNRVLDCCQLTALNHAAIESIYAHGEGVLSGGIH